MERITDKRLQAVVDRINRTMGTPEAPYVKQDDRYVAQIGNYHLSGAYGGKALHQMQTDGGGVRDVFGCGHVSKRDLYDRMHAFLQGVDSPKQAA